jgi:phytoene synthase
MTGARSPELSAAYEACRAIAKREAKNFYYSFRVLPQHKSDAMCVVYAFMRKADDLADDEGLSIDARRDAMDRWTAAWRASRTSPTDDPIFIALNDTQERFAISDELLEQLVAGTTMDLQETQPGVREMTIRPEGLSAETYQVYESFDALYDYCYLVASVVGLVCIRIFGYTDKRAELLAEHTGIAFQLTNILRDIGEDAARGRVYLPLDDIKRTGADLESLSLAAKGSGVSREVLDLMQLELQRSQEYYKAADELIPLVDADSRSAMQVLVTIYHELLERIASDPSKVFTSRVSVPTYRKLAVFAKGVIKSISARGRA